MAHPYPPIRDYALLSDCHSWALVSTTGSIDWCCFHRSDKRAVFARILDWGRGGFFRLAPAGDAEVSRRYLPDTKVVETRFTTDDGVLVLTDALCLDQTDDADGEPTVHPHHELVRRVFCEQGTVEVRLAFQPRFDYGWTAPHVDLRGEGRAVAYGGADALALHSEIPLTQHDRSSCEGVTRLEAGEEAFVLLSHHLPHRLRLEAPERRDRELFRERLAATVSFWRDWCSRCVYEGPYRDAVLRSVLVLKAVADAPTGAIVAAPTTSLPEVVGGVRNWDYRFTWLRDAEMHLHAFFRLGYRAEAEAFMEWVLRTTAGTAEDLQVCYGVGGERLLQEQNLAWLEGYRRSMPVRVGNNAAGQFQLGVYGQLMLTAWFYHQQGGDLGGQFPHLMIELVEQVFRRWDQPDKSLWEVRGAPKHFVSSKVLAWAAVDRALRLADALDLDVDRTSWEGLRTRIRHHVQSQGVDEASGAYVRYEGGATMDASNLLIPLTGFLPPDDDRVMATLARIEKDLTDWPLVHRYREDDGLPGEAAPFVVCSFWYVSALARAGEVGRAREMFERLLGLANDVGLYSEAIDPASGDFLGNYPQTISHSGLVRAAVDLQEAGGG